MLRKRSFVGIETFQHGPSATHYSHCQIFMVTRWPPHGICVYLVPKFDSESKTVSTTLTWKHYQESAFLQQTKSGQSGLVDLLGSWISWLVLRGIRKWIIWLFMSNGIHIQTPVSATLTKARMTVVKSARLMRCHPSLYLVTPHPFLDPCLEGTEYPFLQDGFLKTRKMETSGQGTRRFMR